MSWTENDRVAFLQKLLPLANEVQRATGVPALAMLTQAAVESGWGARPIVFNYWGIKANGKLTPYWRGAFHKAGTHEVVNGRRIPVKANFRKYSSLRNAAYDYAYFFNPANNPRYSQAWANRHDVNRFFLEIARAGYATAPGYGEELIKLSGDVKRRLEKNALALEPYSSEPGQ